MAFWNKSSLFNAALKSVQMDRAERRKQKMEEMNLNNEEGESDTDSDHMFLRNRGSIITLPNLVPVFAVWIVVLFASLVIFACEKVPEVSNRVSKWKIIRFCERKVQRRTRNGRLLKNQLRKFLKC